MWKKPWSGLPISGTAVQRQNFQSPLALPSRDAGGLQLPLHERLGRHAFCGLGWCVMVCCWVSWNLVSRLWRCQLRFTTVFTAELPRRQTAGQDNAPAECEIRQTDRPEPTHNSHKSKNTQYQYTKDPPACGVRPRGQGSGKRKNERSWFH